MQGTCCRRKRLHSPAPRLRSRGASTPRMPRSGNARSTTFARVPRGARSSSRTRTPPSRMPRSEPTEPNSSSPTSKSTPGPPTPPTLEATSTRPSARFVPSARSSSSPSSPPRGRNAPRLPPRTGSASSKREKRNGRSTSSKSKRRRSPRRRLATFEPMTCNGRFAPCNASSSRLGTLRWSTDHPPRARRRCRLHDAGQTPRLSPPSEPPPPSACSPAPRPWRPNEWSSRRSKLSDR
mmetsp:Transcript_3664/g.16789  ORF Transcript_3664/g.16789 Transcript_3664/m.16789 type:complete len:237 (-) Transcript_3664:2691-3401(-)